jgi:predicted RNase H-like HicB family nuclease
MSQGVIVVKAARDAEAGVWYVESSDIPGLNLEGETLEELMDKLPGAILDLLETGGSDAVDVPIELIAHASTRARREAA